jgi:hypothetical protein
MHLASASSIEVYKVIDLSTCEARRVRENVFDPVDTVKSNWKGRNWFLPTPKLKTTYLTSCEGLNKNYRVFPKNIYLFQFQLVRVLTYNRDIIVFCDIQQNNLGRMKAK